MDSLRKAWKAWRSFGQWMADRVGRLVMMLFYFTVAAPFGIGVRLFGDPLQLKAKPPAWEPREQTPSNLNDSRRAF